eukprot:TRINITY_DN760_c0_g1_i1.p1 TRINITY_DN760_c0_g1~~TRINITY_DN760_c0_g1_i1.p1  ORF type:complete len:681 (-),score=103.01 TRINITY_DN760_c0_g1_i1:994-3036(-)
MSLFGAPRGTTRPLPRSSSKPNTPSRFSVLNSAPAAARKCLPGFLLLYGLVWLGLTPALTGHFDADASHDSWLSSSVSTFSGRRASWRVSPLCPSDQPGLGAYLAQQEHDFACLLLVHDVCHVYNPWGQPGSADSRMGVWYAMDPLRNLSAINFSKDACTYYKEKNPKAFPAHLYLGDDPHDLPVLQRHVGKFVHIDEAKRYSSEESRKRGAPTSAASWLLSLSMKYLSMRQESNGGVVSEPIHKVQVALVSSKDAHLGHFVEGMGGLAEIGRHILKEPMTERKQGEEAGKEGGKGAEDGEPTRDFNGGRGGDLAALTEHNLQDLTLFFPMSSQIGPWTSGFARIALGPKTTPLPRKSSHHSICFQTALFALNIPHTADAAEWLRLQAYSAAGLRGRGPRGREDLKGKQGSSRSSTSSSGRSRVGGRLQSFGGAGDAFWGGKARLRGGASRRLRQSTERVGGLDDSSLHMQGGRRRKVLGLKDGWLGFRGPGFRGFGLTGEKEFGRNVSGVASFHAGDEPVIQTRVGDSTRRRRHALEEETLMSGGISAPQLLEKSQQELDLTEVQQEREQQQQQQQPLLQKGQRDERGREEAKRDSENEKSREQTIRQEGEGFSWRSSELTHQHLQPPQYQVTLVKRVRTRTVLNLKEVEAVLRSVFPQLALELVLFEARPSPSWSRLK